MSRALELERLTVRYGEQIVLKDVSFHLDRGDFLGVIGPNGGGKTTLLKAILGLVDKYHGKVLVNGKPPGHRDNRVGYVPQHSEFDKKFPIRVRDVVLMGRLGNLGFRPFYTKNDRELALDALKSVDMLEYRDRQISKLSGGQLQRVLIARALTTDPRLLLLDEPTASVDEKMKTNIYSLLSDLKDRGITIVLVSHDIGVISSYVEKVACLNKHFIYHGTGDLSPDMIEAAYQCPIDLIAHGLPHRVFEHRMHREED